MEYCIPVTLNSALSLLEHPHRHQPKAKRGESHFQLEAGNKSHVHASAILVTPADDARLNVIRWALQYPDSFHGFSSNQAILQVHPICGNCSKTNSECVYDSRSLAQKSDNEENQQRIKRRRSVHVPAEKPAVGETVIPNDSLKEIQEYQARYGGQKPGSDEIAVRLDRLTSMVERLSRTGDSDNIEASASSARDVYASGDQPIASGIRLHSYMSAPTSGSTSRNSSPRRHSDNTGSDDFPIPSGLATDLVDPVGTLNLGHLSLEDGGRPR